MRTTDGNTKLSSAPPIPLPLFPSLSPTVPLQVLRDDAKGVGASVIQWTDRREGDEDEDRWKEEIKRVLWGKNTHKRYESKAAGMTQGAQPTPRECQRGAGRELVYCYFFFQLSSFL